YQLPPVPPRDPHERAYYADTYRSLWFFDAKVWLDTPMTVIELVEVHRQRDDRFKQILGAVRYGEVTADMAEELNAAGARPAPDDALTLATTNATVARINASRLARIKGDALRAVAEVNG